MKWVCAALLVLLLASIAQAAEKDLITQPEFLTKFNPTTSRGVCQVTLVTNQGQQMDGYWPGTSTCEVNFQYAFASGKTITVSAPRNYDAQSTGELTSIVGISTADEPAVRFLTEKHSKSEYNDFTTQPITLSDGTHQAIPIMTFGWCGDAIDATYNTVTTTPASLILKYSSSGRGDCEGLSSNTWEINYQHLNSGRPDMSQGKDNLDAFFGTQPSTQRFTLPLNRACAEYAGTITRVEYRPQWELVETPRIFTGGGTTRTFISQASGSPDTYSVTLQLTAQNTLKSIAFKGKDESQSVGGNLFTLYCVDPIDPDDNEAACTAASSNYKWDSIGKCCGDDTTDVGTLADDRTCKGNDAGQYRWESASATCAYPAGWSIAGLTPAQMITDAQGTTYTIGEGIAYIPALGCCSDPANYGKSHTTATDQQLCIIHTDNRSRWVNASAEESVVTHLLANNVPTNENVTIASDGIRWAFCNVKPSVSVNGTVSTSQPAPLPANAGSCSVCTNNYQACLRECIRTTGGREYDFEQCSSDCDRSFFCSTTEEVTCATGTTCTNDVCACPSGQTWQNGACVEYQPCTAPQVYENGYCVTPATTTSAFAQVDTQTSCYNTTTHICLEAWEPYNENALYLFKGTTYVRNDADRGDATSVCQDGALVPAIKKYTADYSDFGFCRSDQCFVNRAEGCVEKGVWKYDDVCVNVTQSVSRWKSRTQYLADALYATGSGDFILHCEAASDTFNVANGLSRQMQSKLVGNTCVLSTFTGQTTAAGAVLNTANGRPSDTIDPVNARSGTPGTNTFVPPFITTLNATDQIKLDANNCDEALTPANRALDAYVNCNPDKGALFYNPVHKTALFAVEESYTPELTVFDAIRNWWNRLTGTTTPKPLAFNGNKIYIAKKGTRSIYAIQEPALENNAAVLKATIVYTNINSQSLCAQYPTAQCSGNTVTLINPTQEQWEAFTIRVRPS
jgi:hypothetical protein